MEKSQKIFIAIFGTLMVISVALGVAGFILGLQESQPTSTPSPTITPTPIPTPAPSPSPLVADFGNPIVFGINTQAKFDDGLLLTLVEINDSRCPPEAVCVWAGELSPLFRITGGNAGKSLKEIRLGTTTAANATENGYTFTLQTATVSTATIIVTRGEEIILREGQRESSFLLQKMYADRVEGLNFWEYPIATNEGHLVTLRVGEVVSNGCTIQLTLIRIEGDEAVFTKKTDFNRPCPICLAENTSIATPSRAVAVQKLQIGDLVWSVNAEGERVAAIVLKTAKTPVPATHQVVHIVLEDGRELFVSPKHPTVDGRFVGELSSGDALDGSNVASATLVSYAKGYTYDILPSGETGFYWANGILFGTTLR